VIVGPVADHFPRQEKKGTAGRARRRRALGPSTVNVMELGLLLPKYWTCPSISTVAIDHIDRYSEQEKKKDRNQHDE
jgi:hypothetical protein